MKKYIVSLPFFMAAILMIIIPQLAFAHEHDSFKIGNETYQITIGSLNEPLIVDDKSGMDLTVSEGSGMPTMSPDGDMDGPVASSTPVMGLDKTLQLEMIAGDQKKTMNIMPNPGKPGGYITTFFPTVQTTFTYRLFGTVNNVPVDLLFTCNPAGNPITPYDNTPTKISDSVTQLSKSGAFGCAEAKADYGFPEPSLSSYDTAQQLQASARESSEAKMLWISGIIIGILGLVAGVAASRKRRV